MKRLWIGAFMICGLAPFAVAQRGAVAPGGGMGRGGGIGRGGAIGSPGRGGFGRFGGSRWGQTNWGQYGGFGGLWGYPLMDSYDEPSAPMVMVLPVAVTPPEPPPPPPPPPPPAVPVMQEYKWPDTGNPSATTFAILSKDGTRRSAIAVWVQDGVLHYKDSDGTRGRMEIGAIDREATVRVNAERGLKFWLPDTR